jgi:tetratricopeptide (TPR) repeat protein
MALRLFLPISGVLLALAACGGPNVTPIPDTTSRFDALAEPEIAPFAAARARFDAGEIAAARAAFERLSKQDPENVIVGAWLQECEIGLAASESTTTRAIAERWAAAARLHPSAASLVLAARVDPDPKSAAALLEKAETLDKSCAWVFYGRAFLAAQAGDYAEARKWVARSVQADPGHLWTRWLEAWILARSGTVEEGIAALLAWLDRARDDARVESRLVHEADLDLALLWVLDDEPDKARKALESVDVLKVDAVRRLEAAACVEQALHDVKRALAAAEAAGRVAPGELLPALQVAILHDEWLDDPVAAEADWTRVLKMARASSELSAVLQRTRASVRLERFAARRAQSAPKSGERPE